jgi:UDP-glucose 4-epimerase
MRILITGGAGYIGSHICVELLNKGYQVVVVDNLINSSLIALERVALITGKRLTTNLSDEGDIVFFKADIRNHTILKQIFNTCSINAVIHLAGLKSVGESVDKPLEYYDNNVSGSVTLLKEMAKANIKCIIFSSSACVYGEPKEVPVKESSVTVGITSPYGQSKFFIEEVLKDVYKSDNKWKIALLRYFNPVGAHVSGLIGEDPRGVPNNLMPYVSQVAARKLEKLKIFGNDYQTKDGTGIRDYIHVVDLSKGHLSALQYLETLSPSENKEPLIVNLGIGKGVSVLEVVSAMEKVSGKSIPYEIVKRRSGDIAEYWTSTEYAKKKLGWEAQYDLKKMCEDVWRWQQQNPNGYVLK